MATAPHSAQIPHTFDPAFERERGFIPLSFLRALAYSESSLNPNSDMREHPKAHSDAVGLFQIMGNVLADWNLRHPEEPYTREDLFHPITNTRLGVALIERIVKGYANNHPASLRLGWDDSRKVALLVAGYNAGYSQAGGVGHIVSTMEKAGIPPERITVDTVQQVAQQLQKDAPDPKRFSARFLADPDRLAYWKKVTQRYFDDVAQAGHPSGRGPRVVAAPQVPSSSSSGASEGAWPFILGMAVLSLAGLALLRH